MSVKSNAANSAIIRIYVLLLTVFTIGVLYIGQAILIPLMLGVLLTFLLAPIVSYIEPWTGRIFGVLATVLILFMCMSVAGYILTREIIDVTSKLPKYRDNIEVKLRSIHIPYVEAPQETLWDTLQRFENNLKVYDATPPKPYLNSTPSSAEQTPQTAPLALPPLGPSTYLSTATSFVSPLFDFLTTIGLVMLFVFFMLIYREDLRGRVLRLVGQGRIGATTRAMDDASQRISKYLFMQLIINLIYGVIVAGGLYLIGIPNAELWGGLAVILRFIPYIGSWIAATIPIVLSLIISPDWMAPLLTLGLYVFLDLVTSNFIEPWLYGSGTGVSSLALIIAAILWTLIWGPVGLLLSTPLTVCLVVMGRHAPHLEFLSILFSDEQALEMHEELYHRLLSEGENSAVLLIDSYLKEHSLTSLYDIVIIPTIKDIESDIRKEAIDKEKGDELYLSIRNIIDDQNSFTHPTKAKESDEHTEVIIPPKTPYHVICIPARTEQDEIVCVMLAQVLSEQGFLVENLPTNNASETVEYVEKRKPHAVCISIVTPSMIFHARYLCRKLHSLLPELKIIVGLWGAKEIAAEMENKLRSIGANEIVTSLADAESQLHGIFFQTTDEVISNHENNET